MIQSKTWINLGPTTKNPVSSANDFHYHTENAIFVSESLVLTQRPTKFRICKFKSTSQSKAENVSDMASILDEIKC